MERLRQYLCEVEDTLGRLPLEAIHEAIVILHEARLRGRQVFIMGNGGSASTASHFVCDLAKNTRQSGWPSFRAIGLTDNMAIFSAYGNDDGYDNVFALQLANLVQPDDVVIGISASGNSPNVLQAIDLAHQMKATTIAFTGYGGGKLGGMVDLHINVPNHTIEQVEDIHLMLEHMITSALRELTAAERVDEEAARKLIGNMVVARAVAE